MDELRHKWLEKEKEAAKNHGTHSSRKFKSRSYLSRETPSVARTVITEGPDVQIELEFRSVGFCGGRKTGYPGETPSEQGENQQQTQPT